MDKLDRVEKVRAKTGGSYTEAQRTQFLDDQRVDNSIALAVKEMLGR